MSANTLISNFQLALFNRDTHNPGMDVGVKRSGAGTNLTTVFSDMFKPQDVIKFDKGVAAEKFTDMANHVVASLNARNDNPAQEDVVHYYKDTYRVLSALQDTAKKVRAEISDKLARNMVMAMDSITLNSIDQAASFVEGIERRTLREYLMQDLVGVEPCDDWGKATKKFSNNKERLFGEINSSFQESVEAITGENREKLCAGQHKLTGHSNFADCKI